MICSAFSTHFREIRARVQYVCVCVFSSPPVHFFLNISSFFLSARTRDFFSWRGGMLGTSSRTFSSWRHGMACMHLRTHLLSPFVPLAWVATCAPIFAIATQALYLAVET